MSNLTRIQDHVVQVTAPCRIHFGLINCGLGNADAARRIPLTKRVFGGIGAMISRPCITVSVHPSTTFSVDGDLSERVARFTQVWFDHFKTNLGFANLAELPCKLHVTTPPDHIGVGTGTQLALSIDKGLREVLGIESSYDESAAIVMGRGQRSSIGIHGFQQGGFIYEIGREIDQVCSDGRELGIGQLQFRGSINPDWHVVLSTERGQRGLMGNAEIGAFDNCPSNNDGRIAHLRNLIHQFIIPSIQDDHFPVFAKSIGEYGYESGLYFASTQGGAYNGRSVTQLVEAIRAIGFEGVGQTSWGPTIYTLTPTRLAAEQLVHWINETFPNVDSHLTPFDNQGAKCKVIPNTK